MKQPERSVTRRRFLLFGVLMFVLGFITAVVVGKLARSYLAELADESRHVAENVHPDIPLCGKVSHCGSVVAIDCGRHLDGPFNFYDNTNGKLLMDCGFWSRGGLGSKRGEACPPPEWTCGEIPND